MNLLHEIKVFGEVVEFCAGIAREQEVERALIALEWSNRYTNSMGRAMVFNREKRYGRVRLSKLLWPHAKPEKRRNTMVHEVAHIYAELEKRRACHGPVWKRWMLRFGEEPKRCYTDDEVDRSQIKRRKRTRFVFECCCGQRISVSKATRTKWIRGEQVRFCRNCKQFLSVHKVEGAKEEVL